MTVKPREGVNDLESKFPNIAKEWHPTENGVMKPWSAFRARISAFRAKNQ